MIRMLPLLLAGLLTAAQQRIPPLPAAPSQDEARVEVVLFSDFQCPYCAQFSQPFRELQTKSIEGVQASVEFRNFPLFIHPKAQLVHQAALAAKEQNKFWEMHDLIFANQSKADRDDLLGYARTLGLDLKRFQKDIESEGVKQIIAADLAEGQKRGVNGTPTFFVNGKAYSGTRSFDQLKVLVQGEARRKRALAEITDNLLSKGPSGARVTIEFFADLESPVTPPALQAIETIMAAHPDAIRLQFRNFPLSFHPSAPLAHESAMTAALQGRFWEFVNYILHRQDSLREQDLIAYSAETGMDETKFADSIRERRYAARVDADVEAGLQRGVRGSPVIFVNTRRIDGVPSLRTLTEYVEAELAAASATPAVSNSPAQNP